MKPRRALATFTAAALSMPAWADVPTVTNPFPTPIEAIDGAVTVGVVEFASLPVVDGRPAQMMRLIDVPGAGRLFVNDMAGVLYGIGYDGGDGVPWLDLKAPRWGFGLVPRTRRHSYTSGFQSFAFHPQFGEPDTPGFGRLYTFADTVDTEPAADFLPGGGRNLQDTVLLEWQAKDPRAAFYDGGPPRELMRIEQPYADHNGGQIAFNPAASPGASDFGLLYLGVGDGGKKGDPLELSRDLGKVYGKILRIDPLGTNSANGRYGVPGDNPFVGTAGALGEIYAYGLRNPQNLDWDMDGTLFVADIGQATVEEVNVVTPGANLGWDDWEGRFRLVDTLQTLARRVRDLVLYWDLSNDRRAVSLENPRGDATVTWPVVEFDHVDPLLWEQFVAVTGPVVYRHVSVPQLTNKLLFGDLVRGEMFYVDADALPDGGQDAVRRVLLSHCGERKSLLEMVREKVHAQGGEPGGRVDLRFGTGPNGWLFLLNRHDGTVRRVVSEERPPCGE